VQYVDVELQNGYNYNHNGVITVYTVNSVFCIKIPGQAGWRKRMECCLVRV